MVTFDSLLAASTCNTDAEITALVLFYLHEYEACDSATYRDAGDVIDSSNVQLSSQEGRFSKRGKQAVIDPLRSLKRRDIVAELRPTGFRLTDDGYQWIESKLGQAIPDSDTPTTWFVEFEAPDDFYAEAVREINLCFAMGAYTATIVMYRRLMESLLIDIYIRHFGPGDIQKYYCPESGRHENLGALLDTYREHVDELARYSTQVDKQDDLYSEMDSFRKTANSQAHSIDMSLSKSKLLRRSETATRIVRVLYRMREAAGNAEE